MGNRSHLIVPGVEEMLNKHKEELAEEFGTHFSPASRDVITKRLKDEKQKNDDQDCEKE
jgi:hypothetical protein